VEKAKQQKAHDEADDGDLTRRNFIKNAFSTDLIADRATQQQINEKTESSVSNVNAPDVRPPAAVGWRRQRLSQLRLSDAAQTEMLSALGCGWGVVLDWSRPLMIFLVGLGRGGR